MTTYTTEGMADDEIQPISFNYSNDEIQTITYRYSVNSPYAQSTKNKTTKSMNSNKNLILSIIILSFFSIASIYAIHYKSTMRYQQTFNNFQQQLSNFQQQFDNLNETITTIIPIASHYRSTTNNPNYIQSVSKLPQTTLRACSDDKTEKSYTYNPFTLAARGFKIISGKNGYCRSYTNINIIIRQDSPLTI
eukprot:218132_1